MNKPTNELLHEAGTTGVGTGGTRWANAAGRAIVAFCAAGVSAWAHCPWLGTAGLALLGGITFVSARPRLRWSARWLNVALAIACGLGLLVPAAPLVATGPSFTLEQYARYCQAMLAWLVAMSLLPARLGADSPRRLRVAAMACAVVGVAFWLAGAWTQNMRLVFYLGMGATFALLILWKLWFRLTATAILAANTLLLLILVLGIADLFTHPPPRLNPHVAMAQKYYSYEFARRDPLAFTAWWNYYVEQWLGMLKRVAGLERGQTPSFRLRPDSRGRVFDCPIAINHLGFRGREVALDKGDAYRIVALGESTTFGHTLRPSDRPWPELLEQMIQERLKPRRPVEVINAGVPGYTLEDNLARLAEDILPLKPDMIISYHGYNGFKLLDASLPVVSQEPPPVYKPRPLRLLARAELKLKILWFRYRHAAASSTPPPTETNVMETSYARAYRELVEVAQTNNIRLVVANYCMAVNAHSDQDIVDFYRTCIPMARWPVEANQLHSALVREIARLNPAVCLVDTHPNLDGMHDKFIDLVHFTQEGRQQLAENFFAGIRATLGADLAPPAAAP